MKGFKIGGEYMGVMWRDIPIYRMKVWHCVSHCFELLQNLYG